MTIVKILPNGPLLLQGPFRHGGADQEKGALCRCGQSKNKPWCDGAHRACGFADDGVPKADAELADVAGDTEITAFPDGPVMVKGAVEIVGADGAVNRRSGEVYLCRCGASANKPYCDGSHRACGFTAP